MNDSILTPEDDTADILEPVVWFDPLGSEPRCAEYCGRSWMALVRRRDGLTTSRWLGPCGSWRCPICAKNRARRELRWLHRRFEQAGRVWYAFPEPDDDLRLLKRRVTQRGRRRSLSVAQIERTDGRLIVFASGDLAARLEPTAGQWLPSETAYRLCRVWGLVAGRVSKVTYGGAWDLPHGRQEDRGEFRKVGVGSKERIRAALGAAAATVLERYGHELEVDGSHVQLPGWLRVTEWVDILEQAFAETRT